MRAEKVWPPAQGAKGRGRDSVQLVGREPEDSGRLDIEAAVVVGLALIERGETQADGGVSVQVNAREVGAALEDREDFGRDFGFGGRRPGVVPPQGTGCGINF